MSKKEESHLCRRCSNAVKHWKGWELCDFCGHRHHWESGWHDPIPDPIAPGLDGHSPPLPPAHAVGLDDARKALLAAKRFIENGVEFGYIRMPEADTLDSAHEVMPLIRAALSALPERDK